MSKVKVTVEIEYSLTKDKAEYSQANKKILSKDEAEAIAVGRLWSINLNTIEEGVSVDKIVVYDEEGEELFTKEQ